MAVRGESDRSTALAGSSPLTTSTWGGASATLIDKESVVDEEEEKEEGPRGKRWATERRGRVTRRRGRRPRQGRHN